MAKRKYQKWLLTTVDGLRLGLGVAPAFVGLPLGDFEGDTVGLRGRIIRRTTFSRLASNNDFDSHSLLWGSNLAKWTESQLALTSTKLNETISNKRTFCRNTRPTFVAVIELVLGDRDGLLVGLFVGY